MNLTFVTTVAVKLEGKTVGTIKEVAINNNLTVFKYFPTFSKAGGLPYTTLQACMNSLKG